MCPLCPSSTVVPCNVHSTLHYSDYLLFFVQLSIMSVHYVHYSDTRNVFQVFWSQKQKLHIKSIDIIDPRFMHDSDLAQGIQRPIATIVESQDRRNRFLWTWEDVGETVPSPLHRYQRRTSNYSFTWTISRFFVKIQHPHYCVTPLLEDH